MYKQLISSVLALVVIVTAQPVFAGNAVDVVAQVFNPIGDVMQVVVDVVASVTNIVVGAAETVIVSVTSPITLSMCMAGVDFGCDFVNALNEDANCRFNNLSESPIILPACDNYRFNDGRQIGIRVGGPRDNSDGGSNQLNQNQIVYDPNDPLSQIVVIPAENWAVSGGGGGGDACTSITLSNINFDGYDYTVLRTQPNQDYRELKRYPGSQTSFTDTGLKPRTDYQYKFRVFLPSGATDTGAIPVYTKCIPQCGFGVKERSTPKYGTGTLVWQCVNNDAIKDKGRCELQNLRTGDSQLVDPNSGSFTVTNVETTTDYGLVCSNVDGTVTLQQTLRVFEPSRTEVKP